MNILKRVIFIFLFFIINLFALDLNDLKEMPKSIERDFYIWQYLNQVDTSKEEAIEAAKLIYRVNSKLQKAFKAKTSLNLQRRKYFVSKKSKERYNLILKKLKKEKNLFEAWLKLNPKDRLLFFNLAGRVNRKLLNKEFNDTSYLELTNYYAINEFINRAFRENLTSIKDKILNTRPTVKNKITYNNLLKLGFYNLKRDQAKLASYFFYSAMLKAKSRFDADRTLFWLYLSSNKEKFLKKLANSYDFNIYKLIALDFLNQPYPMPKIENIDNIKSDKSINNPIDWARLKQKIFSKNINLYALAKEYKSKESAAVYYYILAKASRYKNQYFPILYKEYLKDYSIHRQALILAIARQESHFIPYAISSSFALGMMQFMPFLIKDIAKKRGEDISLEDIFKPKKSIEYANFHLNYLEKYLYHPLFVAYAYNAGIGYTRRMLRKKLFKEGAYEPYLSMELMDNKQANHYGKKVLANYVIYRMLLGSPIRVTSLINQLTKEELTDRFRIQK